MSRQMTLRQVRGNTWVIRSWLLIPLYKLDEHRCILLDSGLPEQQGELDGLLKEAGLTCVGILGSHAHMDHAGNNAFFQKTYGAEIALSLGEAGTHAGPLSLQCSVGNLSPAQMRRDTTLGGPTAVADVVIWPEDRQVILCGAEFQVIHTPGHSADHICVITPDRVCYLGDAVMTGRTLFRSKFPFMVSVEDYLQSLRLLREIKAEAFVAAHGGVYPEILPYIDMELRFLHRRMGEILALAEGEFTVEDLAVRIGHAYRISPRSVEDALYFERASQTYLHYLLDEGALEAVLVEGRVRYRKTPKARNLERRRDTAVLPKPGQLILGRAMSKKRVEE